MMDLIGDWLPKLGWGLSLLGWGHVLLLWAFKGEYCNQRVAASRGAHSIGNSLTGHWLVGIVGALLLGQAHGQGIGNLLAGLAVVVSLLFLLCGESALVDYRYSASRVYEAVKGWARAGVAGVGGGATRVLRMLGSWFAKKKLAKGARPEDTLAPWHGEHCFNAIEALTGFVQCPYTPLDLKQQIVIKMHELQTGADRHLHNQQAQGLVRQVEDLYAQLRLADQLFLLRAKQSAHDRPEHRLLTEGLSVSEVSGSSLLPQRLSPSYNPANPGPLLDPIWADLRKVLEGLDLEVSR